MGWEKYYEDWRDSFHVDGTSCMSRNEYPNEKSACFSCGEEWEPLDLYDNDGNFVGTKFLCKSCGLKGIADKR